MGPALVTLFFLFLVPLFGARGVEGEWNGVLSLLPAQQATLFPNRKMAGDDALGPRVPYKPTYVSDPRLNGACRLADFDAEEAPVARGAYSAVYRAVHRPTGQTFALKRLPSFVLQLTPQFIAAEERLQHELVHPHIAYIYCSMLSAKGDNVFLVMDYLEGGDLERAARLHLLKPPERSHVVAQILDAIHHVHSKGYGHFDVKPANVMLAGGEGKDGDHDRINIKLIDFGFSQADTTDQILIPLGTPFYMAPEVIRAEGAYGRAADYYSLACTIYTLVTGIHPWANDVERLSLPVLFHGIGTGMIRLPLTGDAQTDELLERLAQFDPKQRWRLAFEEYDQLVCLPFFRGTDLAKRLCSRVWPPSVWLIVTVAIVLLLLFSSGVCYLCRWRRASRQAPETKERDPTLAGEPV